MIVRYNTDQLTRSYAHTDELFADRALFAVFGASPENTEARVGGVQYVGPLSDTDEVRLTSKANSKQA